MYAILVMKLQNCLQLCFYEDLYELRSNDCKQGSSTHRPMDQWGHARPFSPRELADALKTMKDSKTSDQQGVISEMPKNGDSLLRELLLDLFNDVIAAGKEAPEVWRMTRLVVIFKKGDPRLPNNYRLIAILPIIYKLFSRMLWSRI